MTTLKTAKHLGIFVVLAASLIGCRAQIKEDATIGAFNSVDEDAFIIDAALEPLNDLDESDAESNETNVSAKITHDNCRTDGEISSNLTKFEDHQVLGSRLLLDGELQRTFNNADCSFADAGDELLREYDLEFQNIYRGGKLAVNSDDHRNYLGQSLGGGDVISKYKDSYGFEIQGRHNVLKNGNGRTIMDVSVSTPQPFQILNGLRRSVRKIESGQVEINHNLAQYTTTVTFTDLNWSADCRCPVSGEVDIQRDGRIEFDKHITFQACGVVKIENSNGGDRTVQLPRCQK